MVILLTQPALLLIDSGRLNGVDGPKTSLTRQVVLEIPKDLCPIHLLSE